MAIRTALDKSLLNTHHKLYGNITRVFQSANSFPSLLKFVYQKTEVDKIKRYHYEKDKQRALLGQILIRGLIHTLFSVPYQDIKITRSEKGKPEYSNLNFNISHDGDLVVLLWSLKHQVGVDVMHLERHPKPKIESFTKQFTENEWKIIGNDLDRFFTQWALKESYIKLIGTGLSTPLQSIQFDKNKLSMLENNIWIKQNNIFFETQIVENHIIATACEENNEEKWFEVNYEVFTQSVDEQNILKVYTFSTN
eukprot:snap_masked-scaffold_26-processed-gene-4.126-mRNA-1 protein AED:1.00 eAED:1.00 QI:0/-1/0/0/-1/1/1/0/251